MKIISKIDQTENVSIVSIDKAASDIHFLSRLFCAVADRGILVDMISQTAPKGNKISLSFTVSDEKTAELLGVVKSLNERNISTMVSVGNVKLSLYGEAMPAKVGVAADVFEQLKKAGIDILLITTSDTDISIVVTAANADRAEELLQNAYLK